MERKEEKEVSKIENGEAEAKAKAAGPNSSNDAGSIFGFDSLHQLLQACLPPHLFQFSKKVQNGAGTRNGGHRLTTLTQRMGDLGLSQNLDGSPQELKSRSVLDNAKELNSVNGGVKLGSANRVIVVTNTTIEVAVPENVMGAVYGENGSNLTRLRQLKLKQPDPLHQTTPDQSVALTLFINSSKPLSLPIFFRLRDNQFSNKVQNGAGTRNGGHRLTTLTQRMGDLGLSQNLDGSPQELKSRSVLDNAKELNSVNGGVKLGSANRAIVVTNTTIEIAVPENVMGSVYGENGSNLTRLRQISGAKVIVHEPHPGTSDRIVVISGNPDETQAAQSLLQAFILSGSS